MKIVLFYPSYFLQLLRVRNDNLISHFTLITAISRIMDNKHHPTDVIAGSLIGIICQILNVFGVTLIFSENSVPKSEKNKEESYALRQGNGSENQRTVD